MLHLFIYFDIFILGAIAAVAAMHGYAHFRPPEHEKGSGHHAAEGAHLPSAVREQLLQKAETNFSHALDRSATKLEEDLKATEASLTQELDKLGSELVKQEIARYKQALTGLQEHTKTVATQASADLDTHQTDLKSKMQAEFAAEKQHLMEQIDAKLTDAVMSFLLETLQHNVDLGAQSAYLTSMLEEHKDEFKQGVADEAPAAG